MEESNATAGDGPFNNSGLCSPFPDDFYCDIILSFRRVVGIVSLLCCVFIITVIVLFQKYKFISQRLILYLTISAVFQTIGYITGDYRLTEDGSLVHLCRFQGFCLLYFDWSSFLWVGCITFSMFWNTVVLRSVDKFEKFYHMICWGAPLLICCLPFIDLAYGPAGIWCWISAFRNDELFLTGVILQLVVYYIPFWIISVLIISVLVYITYIVNKRFQTWRGVGTPDPKAAERKKQWNQQARPLRIFPWLYLTLLIFPSANWIRLVAGFDDTVAGNFIFWFLQAVTLPLHGTLYALVFACDRSTLSRLTPSEIKKAIRSFRTKDRVEEYEINRFGRSDTLYIRTLDKNEEEVPPQQPLA